MSESKLSQSKSITAKSSLTNPNPILKISIVQHPYLNPLCVVIRRWRIKKYAPTQASVKRLQRALWQPVVDQRWCMRPIMNKHVGWLVENQEVRE